MCTQGRTCKHGPQAIQHLQEGLLHPHHRPGGMNDVVGRGVVVGKGVVVTGPAHKRTVL